MWRKMERWFFVAPVMREGIRKNVACLGARVKTPYPSVIDFSIAFHIYVFAFSILTAKRTPILFFVLSTTFADD